MAGRLEQYRNEFPREARNNADNVKPMDRNKDEYARTKDLSGMDTMEVLAESRAHSMLCYLVYREKSTGDMIQRPAVIPHEPLNKMLPKSKIEIIDMRSLTRKAFLLNRLKKAIPTGKEVKINQKMIQYPV